MALRDLLFSLFVAVLMVVGGAGFSYAGELKISGFADVILTLSDEANDDAGLDADGDAANSTELKTSVAAEVDFEYTEGPVTFRLDLDIPSSGNEAPGVVPFGDIGIEQAKFVWAIPAGDPLGLSLTGGAFNAPIGFEAQDAPDLYQTSNGQLFGLVPSNLAGFMVSGGTGPVALDVYFANEFRGAVASTGGTTAPTVDTDGDGVLDDDFQLLGEENSYGGLLTIAPIEMASLAVGYITSPEFAGDENVLDVVLTGELSGLSVTQNITDVALLGALEYLTDEDHDAFAIVANLMHNTPSYPHGLTVRYDSVDHDSSDATTTSLTVAGIVNLADNLSALVEWNTFDPDASGLDETDIVTLEFIATFP